MFTALALAAVITASSPSPAPLLVDNPYACPASTPWAAPSGSEAHPYQCVAADFGEQTPDPSHPVKPTAAPTPAPSSSTSSAVVSAKPVARPTAHPVAAHRRAQATTKRATAPVVKNAAERHPAAQPTIRRVAGDLTSTIAHPQRRRGIPKHWAGR